MAGEGEAAGGGWDDGRGKVEVGDFIASDWKVSVSAAVDTVRTAGFAIVARRRVEGCIVAAGERAYVDEQRAGSTVRAAVECGREAGGGTGLHERGADGVADEVVDEAGLAETDFGLGGMNVDVDFLRRHLEEEQDDGEGCGWKDVAIGFAERVEDELVADEALVDEDVDGVAIEFLQLGFGDEAGDAEKAGFGSGVVGFALPGRRFGDAGAGEVHLGGDGEHVVAGVFAEDLEEAVGRRWRLRAR